jgi:TonB dependent receptor/TonB-dependent Receptor Plug Domain/CarboxypepD_reg-like domain
MRIFYSSLLIFLYFLFMSLPAFSQKKVSMVAETGSVIDGSTQLPVEGASVNFYSGRQLTATNEQGKFSIKLNVQNGDTLLVSAIGYETKKISYEDYIKSNKTIFLKNKIIEMNAVMVALNPGDHYKPISKIDIKMRDITNSQEVLRLVPGLFIGQHAGGGKAEQIFLRGFDIDHGTDINIAVDGMPVNMVSHAHGQGYADLHFLIPELIENVSFKKGSYYAEKGNLATAGYVDFRTKDVLPSNMVKLEAGQFNTYRTLGMVNLLSEKAKKKEQHAFIASEYMYTKGYFDNPQNFNRLNIFGKYHGRIGEKNTLNFSASTFSSKWKASGQIPERALQSGLIGYFGAIDPSEGGNTGRSNINAQLLTKLGNGNFIKNQFYYTRYDFELFSNFTFFLNNDVDGDQIRQKEKRDILGYNGSYTLTSYMGDKKLTTDIGAGFRLDKTMDSELSRTKDRTTITEAIKLGDIKELNTGIWINETIRMNERFSINAGLRWDRFDVSYKDKLDNNKLSKADAGILSPKLNFYYQLNDKTQVYLTTGRGFHSNDTRVVVQTGGTEILPAAYGADLGVVLKPTPELLLQGALWYLKLDQEFVYVGDEGVVEPSGKSRRLGVDISARYQPVKWLFIDADANYSNGRAMEEMKGQNYLPLAPVFTSIGGITYKSAKGLNAAMRYRYMGDRPANEDNSVIAKGYFVTDAVVSYEKKRFEVGLSVQNLFDVRWKETQFDTESKLQNETTPVSEIHFTPGSPFFFKTHISFFF